MSDLKKELSNSSAVTEEKLPHFTHAGTMQDPSLSQLRDQIKKVMIPLLIKTFQLKLELNQTLSLPSRLQNIKHQAASEEIISQLEQLDKDLKVLLLWCQSCHSQIQKALCPPEDEQKSTVATTALSSTNPAVSKSFSDAVAAKSSPFHPPYPQEESEGRVIEPPLPTFKKKWWQSLLYRARYKKR